MVCLVYIYIISSKVERQEIGLDIGEIWFIGAMQLTFLCSSSSFSNATDETM